MLRRYYPALPDVDMCMAYNMPGDAPPMEACTTFLRLNQLGGNDSLWDQYKQVGTGLSWAGLGCAGLGCAGGLEGPGMGWSGPWWDGLGGGLGWAGCPEGGGWGRGLQCWPRQLWDSHH